MYFFSLLESTNKKTLTSVTPQQDMDNCFGFDDDEDDKGDNADEEETVIPSKGEVRIAVRGGLH